MKNLVSSIVKALGYRLVQSVGDAKANPPANDGKRIDNGRTVYAQNGNTRQVWTDGQYDGQYKFAE